jgi:hypothetical protein
MSEDKKTRYNREIKHVNSEADIRDYTRRDLAAQVLDLYPRRVAYWAAHKHAIVDRTVRRPGAISRRGRTEVVVLHAAGEKTEFVQMPYSKFRGPSC